LIDSFDNSTKGALAKDGFHHVPTIEDFASANLVVAVGVGVTNVAA